MVLDTTLLNTQHYKRYISRVKWSNPEKGLHPPQYLGVVATQKGVFGSPSTTVANFFFFFCFFYTNYQIYAPSAGCNYSSFYVIKHYIRLKRW